MHSVHPHITQSVQTLDYIILHYITMVFCNLHCIHINTFGVTHV